MGSDRRRAVAKLSMALVFIAIPVANLAQGWVNDRRRLLLTCVQLVLGVLLAGWGAIQLRKAKESNPDVSWPRFLRAELCAFAVIASFMATYALMPESARESMKESLRDLNEALHALRAGHP